MAAFACDVGPSHTPGLDLLATAPDHVPALLVRELPGVLDVLLQRYAAGDRVMAAGVAVLPPGQAAQEALHSSIAGSAGQAGIPPTRASTRPAAKHVASRFENLDPDGNELKPPTPRPYIHRTVLTLPSSMKYIEGLVSEPPLVAAAAEMLAIALWAAVACETKRVTGHEYDPNAPPVQPLDGSGPTLLPGRLSSLPGVARLLAKPPTGLPPGTYTYAVNPSHVKHMAELAGAAAALSRKEAAELAAAASLVGPENQAVVSEQQDGHGHGMSSWAGGNAGGGEGDDVMHEEGVESGDGAEHACAGGSHLYRSLVADDSALTHCHLAAACHGLLGCLVLSMGCPRLLAEAHARMAARVAVLYECR